MNVDGFIKVLKLRISGDKGWYVGTCPFCGKQDKFGVIFTFSGRKRPRFHCFSAACSKRGRLSDLAKHIGHPEFMSGEDDRPIDVTMSVVSDLFESDEVHELDECLMPVGFRRIYEHQYLSDRGIPQWQVRKHIFGITKIHPKFADRIIIPIHNDGVCVGFVSRTVHSKEWLDEYSNRTGGKYPRYCNSESDFSSLLYGSDELNYDVDIVVCVEGVFDKLAVDRKMNMEKNVVCVSSFGTKLSGSQMRLVRRKTRRDVEFVIMYDAGEIAVSKDCAAFASGFISDVSIVSLVSGDPDEVSAEEMNRCMTERRSVTEFSLSELNILSL